MIFGILICVAVGIYWGYIGVAVSRVLRPGEDPVRFFLTMNLLLGAASWLVLPRWGMLLGPDQVPRLADLWTVMPIAGFLNVTFILVLSAAMKRGHQGMSWTIGQCCMVWPFLISMFWWHDRVAWHGIVGVGLVLSTIILLGALREKKRDRPVDRSWLPIVLLAFLIGGAGQTMTTVPSRWEGFADAARVRYPIFILGQLAAAASAAVLRRTGPAKRYVPICLVLSIFGLVSGQLFYKAMDNLRHAGILAVAYPLAVGVCILTFTLYSRIILKEHFGWAQWTAVGLGFAGILLVSTAKAGPDEPAEENDKEPRHETVDPGSGAEPVGVYRGVLRPGHYRVAGPARAMVRRPHQTRPHPTGCGLSHRLDYPLPVDGRGCLAGVVSPGRWSGKDDGPGGLRGAACAQRRLVAGVLRDAAARRGPGGAGMPVGGHRGDPRLVPAREAPGGLAVGAVPCLGELCRLS